jgi:hypothetical protein
MRTSTTLVAGAAGAFAAGRLRNPEKTFAKEYAIEGSPKGQHRAPADVEGQERAACPMKTASSWCMQTVGIYSKTGGKPPVRFGVAIARKRTFVQTVGKRLERLAMVESGLSAIGSRLR